MKPWSTPSEVVYEPTSVPGSLMLRTQIELVQAFNTRDGNFVKGRSTVLESMIGRAGIRAQCLSAIPAW